MTTVTTVTIARVGCHDCHGRHRLILEHSLFERERKVIIFYFPCDNRDNRDNRKHPFATIFLVPDGF